MTNRVAETERVVVVDVETTGLDSARDQILEIAIRDGVGEEAATWTQRVRPSIPIPASASAVHGITNEDVAAAPSFADIAEEVRRRIEGAAVIIGYNVGFDLSVLSAEFARAGTAPLDLERTAIVDPYHVWRNVERHTLTGAHERFVGEPLNGAHGAAADVAATVRVLHRMRSAFGLDGVGWERLAELSRPRARRPARVILFDGMCNLCSGWVSFVLKRDPEGRFAFATLQSDAAQRLLARDATTRAVDSIVLVEQGRVFVQSTAALRILKGLGGGWALAYGLVIVPRFLRDAVYAFVARHRYRWFGRRDACYVPGADTRGRFLD